MFTDKCRHAITLSPPLSPSPVAEMSGGAADGGGDSPTPAPPAASREQLVERSLVWAADICRMYPQIFSLIYIIFKESSCPAEALAWFRNREWTIIGYC